ncbi:hypothetical protein MA16_Dca018167 [Dendrobium catenatum]|uniref:Uncharacterized protein n=1 Tax=Dendrobium catenatum TaxID=906689 RepID=A0A2I0VST1_9ASPA|nr:hypothetical protein MA16_Dca018167 [Dendrobium catenatum]
MPVFQRLSRVNARPRGRRVQVDSILKYKLPACPSPRRPSASRRTHTALDSHLFSLDPVSRPARHPEFNDGWTIPLALLRR